MALDGRPIVLLESAFSLMRSGFGPGAVSRHKTQDPFLGTAYGRNILTYTLT